jgi:hypothetical protein
LWARGGFVFGKKQTPQYKHAPNGAGNVSALITYPYYAPNGAGNDLPLLPTHIMLLTEREMHLPYYYNNITPSGFEAPYFNPNG